MKYPKRVWQSSEAIDDKGLRYQQKDLSSSCTARAMTTVSRDGIAV